MDQADMDILAFLGLAIAVARGIRNSKPYSAENDVYCQECGDEISSGRLEDIAGWRHWIDCARFNERQQQGFGRKTSMYRE